MCFNCFLQKYILFYLLWWTNKAHVVDERIIKRQTTTYFRSVFIMQASIFINIASQKKILNDKTNYRSMLNCANNNSGTTLQNNKHKKQIAQPSRHAITRTIPKQQCRNI